MPGAETIIRVLTCAALAGLLGAVGLRLTLDEVKTAVRKCRIVAILVANFVVVPALVVIAAKLFDLPRDLAIGMILLGSAPFAPVVPVFVRLARGDLALAAGLTAAFPLISVVLTPLACRASLATLAETQSVQFNMLTSLGVLAATITLPLAVGVFVHYRAPNIAKKLLRPIEIISEAAGALSLTFVVVTEFDSIRNLGWHAWLAMAIVCELSMLLGWFLGGPANAARQVIAFGTSNRNIALALLVALQSFPGTPVFSAVVGNGLLLILLGLAHVAVWRLAKNAPP